MDIDEPQANAPAPFTLFGITATFEHRSAKKNPHSGGVRGVSID
jgi:hypothetical protein